jgi:hypothetical protein
MKQLPIAQRQKLVQEFALFRAAMAKGARIAQPCIDSWIIAMGQYGIKACPLGTVALGGMTDREVEYVTIIAEGSGSRKIIRFLKKTYPTLLSTRFFTLTKGCPEPGCSNYPAEMNTLYQLVPHLADDHQWTRRRVLNFITKLVHEAETA